MTSPAPDARKTIVARSTPSGWGFRTMVRLSGPEVFPALGLLARELDLDSIPGGTAVLATLKLVDSTSVPVRILLFRAPRSYTGEDVAEVYFPGIPILIGAVLESFYNLGIRPAGPGEFTRRAYLSGRLDLTRAEGIQALIAANTDAERRGALSLTGGRMADRVESLRESLMNLLADLEASLDFMDHEVDPETIPGLEERLMQLENQIRDMMNDTRGDSRPSGAPRVILWGHPNAGKSTLFNCLVGRERAAVDRIPGTTRDVISGRVRTLRGELLLFDAPGIGLAGNGEADQAAQKMAAEQRKRMDLRLVIADASNPLPPPDAGPEACMLVLSKIDLERRLDPASWIEAQQPVSVVEVSAKEGTGIEALGQALGNWLIEASPGQDEVISAGRLHALFRKGLGDLTLLREEHEKGFGAECLSIHVRALISSLEEVTGRVFTEELLDTIFSRFCIGK